MVEVHRPNQEAQIFAVQAVPLDPELPGFILDANAIVELANPLRKG
jgi:hypothetical protein